MQIEQLNAEPSLISKLNTFLQIVLVLVFVVNHGLYPLPVWMLDGLIWSVAVTTGLSGIAYVIEWSRRAITKSHANDA